MEKSIIFLDKK
jgi:hypothetical protein